MRKSCLKRIRDTAPNLLLQQRNEYIFTIFNISMNVKTTFPVDSNRFAII
jgi:hypothetical protein